MQSCVTSKRVECEQTYRLMQQWVKGIRILLACMCLLVAPKTASAAGVKPSNSPAGQVPHTMRLSLDETLAFFLKQNLDLLITKYGIDSFKGRAITAGLFPNPKLSINTLSSYTQRCNLNNCGAVLTVLSQLFEVAGKRGYRVEGAGYGTQSAEANFEDTIRQLSFAVKDAYYRVRVGQQHLAVDKKSYFRLSRILEDKSLESKKSIEQPDLVRLRIQAVEAQAQVIHDIQDIDAASADLRVLLGIPPDTELTLTTDLTYHHMEPSSTDLRRLATGRPDIRAKRALYSQRKAEMKLALAVKYPDFTVDLGYMVQGPQGPDNQQQWTLNFGVPLKLFDRNQGGIMEASAAVQAAQADLQKTLNELDNEVETAYRRLIQSRRLVETYREGVLDDVRSLFATVEKAYNAGTANIFDFLDAARTASDIQEEYLEALFSYQRDVLLLESAIGQEIG